MKIKFAYLVALVLLALTLVLPPALAHAQVASKPVSVGTGLTVGRLKQHCLTTGGVGATRTYLSRVFAFFERGSTGAAAAASGMSHSEFNRQLRLGFEALPACQRQLSNVN